MCTEHPNQKESLPQDIVTLTFLKDKDILKELLELSSMIPEEELHCLKSTSETLIDTNIELSTSSLPKEHTPANISSVVVKQPSQ